MKFLTTVITLLLFAGVSLAADSALVAAAKKEKERREKVNPSKPVRTITNDDVEQFIEQKVASGELSEDRNKATSEADDTDSEGPSVAPKKPSAYDELFKGHVKQKPDEGKDEQYWRNRKADLESSIQDKNREISQLQGEIGKMESALSDPGHSGYVLKNPMSGNSDITNMKNELQEKQQQLSDLQEQRDNLDEEARKAGALPGWLRN